MAETDASQQDVKKEDQLRIMLAEVYTFVRSREINKTILTFTFDHYIDEAKRTIKEERKLRSASGIDAGTRPAHLKVLEIMQEDFNKNYEKMKELAETSDKAGEQETEQAVEATVLPEGE